jgi:hypothetical protein
MAEKTDKQFGRRRPVVVQNTAPVKRSHHVALLLMGTFAIGGGAYALMPRESCTPAPAGMAAAAALQAGAECPPRGSSSSSSGGHGSSGGSSSRSSFFSGDTSSSSHSASGTSSDSGSGGVTRGGFGSFAHAFSSHFSGGG